MIQTILAFLLIVPSSFAAAPRCLEMKDHHATNPIRLEGRLAFTYVDQTIDPIYDEEGRNHEIGTLDFSDPQRRFQRLTNNLDNESEVEISPDGSRILYTLRRKLDDFGNASGIHWMRFDGSSDELLLSGQPMGVPAWNYPVGDSFTFIQWGNQSGDSRLHTFHVGNRRTTPFPTKRTGQADPEVSYDGKLITFKMAVRGDRDFQPSIYVMGRDGKNLRRLTRGWSDHDPVFSRDGKKIYFERYYGPGDWFEASQDRSVPEHNMWGIVEVDVRTKKERVIAPHDPCGKHFFWLPTLSPDGKHLMYTHVDVWGRVWTDLWVSTTDGRHKQKVRGSDWIYFFDWTK